MNASTCLIGYLDGGGGEASIVNLRNIQRTEKNRPREKQGTSIAEVQKASAPGYVASQMGAAL